MRGRGLPWRCLEGAAVLLLCWASAAAAAGPQVAAPNIILITVDTFRPDHLGYYGYDRDTSPHLDTLSSEGVFFRQAFATSAWTAPGLISIQTSLYGPTHGVDIRGRSMDPQVVTLAEALGQAGYRAPDIFFLTDVPNFQHLGLEPYGRKRQYVRQGDEILFRWLEEEAHSGAAPFYLYYHYRDLHQPYLPLDEFDLYTDEAFGHRYNPWSWFKRFAAREKRDLVRREVLLPRGVMDFTAWDKPWVDALYDGQVRQLDERFFGRLRRTLTDLSLTENTVVVISADHGEELLEHGLIGHVSTYKEGHLHDELTRIPLIFWYPSRLTGGRVVDEPVQCIDIMPTLLELAGTRTPAGAQGASLVPLLEGAPGWRRRPVFMETSGGGYGANVEQYARRVRAVRTERWKLVHSSPEDERVLYDLAADPREERDVRAAHPAVADSLEALLWAWHEASARRPSAGGAPAEMALPLASAAAPDPGERPVIAYPVQGDTLEYLGEDQSIGLRWSGDSTAAYTIQYEVGLGAYHLEGELPVTGNEPAYGPFHESFWNPLVLYNPWRFRVYPAGSPELASEWVSFHLAPSAAAGGWSVTGLGLAAAASLAAAADQVGLLAWGLGLGLLDLYGWVAQVPAADVTAWALIAAIAAAAVWPRLRRLGVERCQAWGAALAYIAFVYATVPVFPAIWDRLRDHTEGAIAHLGIAVIAALALGLADRVRRAVGRRAWEPYAVLAVVFVAYGYLLARFSTFPAERLHLVEYGLVSVFLVRALRLDLPPRTAYLASLVLTTVVGFGDECIQWALPQRFFELKDVQLNAISGALGLAIARFALFIPAESQVFPIESETPGDG